MAATTQALSTSIEWKRLKLFDRHWSGWGSAGRAPCTRKWVPYTVQVLRSMMKLEFAAIKEVAYTISTGAHD